MRTYQDEHTGELWCEVKKGDTTVHRKATVTVNSSRIHSSMRSPLHTVEPELFSGERLVTTLLDMEIIQERTNEQRPRTSDYLGGYGSHDPEAY